MTQIKEVGFLGLGQMGGAIAERLLEKSFRLHVFDPSVEASKSFGDRGAVLHDSVRSVANVASVVFACLPSQEVSIQAALGADGVIQGTSVKIYVEMSTIGNEAVNHIASKLALNDIAMVDSPVTGGPPVARAGNLTLLTAGAPENIKQLEPILALMGKNIYQISERLGMGQMMKVINNLIMATNVVVACEGLSMGAKAGLDPAMMLAVLNNGTGQSFALNEIISRGVYGTFDFGAALSILDKDVTLGLKDAEALGAILPVIDAARKQWRAALEDGMGREDFTAMLRFVEKNNGTVVRASA